MNAFINNFHSTNLIHISAFLILGSLGFLLSESCADGCYIPDRAFERLPELPRQRALIVFDGGKETLVIESSMDAQKGQRFGWVLPLPSLPSVIEPVKPGILSSLEFLLRPEIKTKGHVDIRTPIWLLPFSLIITVWIITFDPAVRRMCFHVLLYMAIFSFVFLISVSHYAGGASSELVATEALRHERIGNYEVAVIRSENANDLRTWITENDFAPLPLASSDIINDYIDTKWVFVVAKLLRNEKGMLTPHPLKITFPSSEPVYPMRLTALGNTKTDIKLFVKGEHPFTHPSLHIQYSDMYATMRDEEEKTIKTLTFRNTLYDYNELADLLGASGWITCLHSQISPKKMKEDFILKESENLQPHRDTFYTKRAAMTKSIAFVLWSMVVSFPMVGIMYRRHRTTGKKVVAALLSVIIAAGVVHFFALPLKGNVTIQKHYSIPHIGNLADSLSTLQKEEYSSEDDLKSEIRKRLEGTFTNPFTGEPLREEHSPGNFGFRHNDEGTLELVLYSESCYPFSIREFETYLIEGRLVFKTWGF